MTMKKFIRRFFDLGWFAHAPERDRPRKELEIERTNRNAQYLYVIFGIFTCVLILMQWLEALGEVPWLKSLHGNHWLVPFSAISLYDFMLAVYISSKELSRWCQVKRTTRRGGRWVAVWWITFMAISLLSMIFENIAIPRYLPSQCMIVLVAFFGSETAKKLFIKRMTNNHE